MNELKAFLWLGAGLFCSWLCWRSWAIGGWVGTIVGLLALLLLVFVSVQFVNSLGGLPF